ncbi:unnamed protein product, partial [Angiostrongylus costaricensis]|uniref:Lipase_GDSL domain-containing protein n=1 Tax=Angiostrongylus costaricensis TaxID=334426 RepID=A0A0R3PEG6_ANGCS
VPITIYCSPCFSVYIVRQKTSFRFVALPVQNFFPCVILRVEDYSDVPTFLYSSVSKIYLIAVFPFSCLQSCLATKTLGGVLRCDPEVMKPSAKTPDDVNQVRPADINVIAAMGDSITASFINYDDDPYNVYPGNSYVIGGDETLEKHISVANILRVFNPSIVGMSHGTGYDNTVFNVAVSGRTSMDIPRQAEELIHRMKARGVRLRDDWKLISIFIGTNDLGELRCYSKEVREIYKTKLEEGISLLRSNLNRTIVSIVSMWNPELTIDARSLIEEGWAFFYFTCFMSKIRFHFVAYELQNERRFDHKDFTVVVQGFMDDIKDAFRNKSGEYDKSFYASDVFHLSKYGNAVVGKFLWNNLIEPVDQKTTKADLGNDDFPIKCPSKVCLYVFYTPCLK